MRDLRSKLQKPAMKYVVLTLAVANCAGLYLAHDRLNRPYSGPSSDTAEAPVAVADASSMMESFASDSTVSLGIDAGPPAAVLASRDALPELAPLPAIKPEAAPVIPSVPLRTVRTGASEPRAARIVPASLSESRAARVRAPVRAQAERGFDAAFTPDYAALAPYDGSAETAAPAETVSEAVAVGASEVRSEAISIDTSMSAGPFTAPVVSETSGNASSGDHSAPAPLELPPVQLTAPAPAVPG